MHHIDGLQGSSPVYKFGTSVVHLSVPLLVRFSRLYILFFTFRHFFYFFFLLTFARFLSPGSIFRSFSLGNVIFPANYPDL